MTSLLRGIALLLILASAAVAEVPQVNIPPSLRQTNWVGKEGNGSCVHASMITLLNWQRLYGTAAWWKQHYDSGETWNGLTAKVVNIRWAGTYNSNNVKFLEWAVRTRRGCMVTCQNGEHMVTLVHLDANVAGIIDNNAPGTVIWKSRESFLQEWYASSSWALTPVYTPPPPIMRSPK